MNKNDTLASHLPLSLRNLWALSWLLGYPSLPLLVLYFLPISFKTLSEPRLLFTSHTPSLISKMEGKLFKNRLHHSSILAIRHGARPCEYICDSEGGQNGFIFEAGKKIKLFHHLSGESQRSLCMNFSILLCSLGFCIQLPIYSDEVVGIKWNSREEQSMLTGLDGCLVLWLHLYSSLYKSDQSAALRTLVYLKLSWNCQSDLSLNTSWSLIALL